MNSGGAQWFGRSVPSALVFVCQQMATRSELGCGLKGFFTRRASWSPDLQERLERVHRTWTWSSRDSKWEQGFSHLLLYVSQNGHAQPKIRDSIDGYPIGKWVPMQRSAYRKDKLPVERRVRLEGVHPTWTWDRRSQ